MAKELQHHKLLSQLFYSPQKCGKFNMGFALLRMFLLLLRAYSIKIENIVCGIDFFKHGGKPKMLNFPFFDGVSSDLMWVDLGWKPGAHHAALSLPSWTEEGKRDGKQFIG